MLRYGLTGLFAGGGADSPGGVTPCRCKQCNRTVSAKGVGQSIQVCPKCRIGGNASKRRKKKR